MTDFNPAEYRPQPDEFADRVILVTGASGGIGSAVALACASHGARVVLTGRKVKKLEELYDSIRAAGGPRPSIAPLDFERADASHYAALADAVRAEFGRLDGLAHVAAQLGERAPIEHHDVVAWMRTMHVNVNVPFILTQSLLPLLKASSDASVVFTTSGVSVRGRAYWGSYAASKFAVEGLMQVLADETGTFPQVRVNSLNPGPVRTAMRAKAYPGEDASTVAPPSACVPAYLWLLGPASRGVSGRRFDAQPSS